MRKSWHRLAAGAPCCHCPWFSRLRGTKKEEAGSAESGDGKSITLRIMWWGSQARHDATLKALDLYSKEPGHHIRAGYQSFDGYQDKLSTQSAGKNTPDIFQMDAAWFNDWASSGRLEDLSSIPVDHIDKRRSKQAPTRTNCTRCRSATTPGAWCITRR